MYTIGQVAKMFDSPISTLRDVVPTLFQYLFQLFSILIFCIDAFLCQSYN